jgi:hypothetical protein
LAASAAVFNVHGTIDWSSSSSIGRDGQNVEHLHFVLSFYHPHDIIMIDADLITSIMK